MPPAKRRGNDSVPSTPKQITETSIPTSLSEAPAALAARIAAVPRRHDNDNPLWAGPCGKGDLGGITQSMLGRFFGCRERFRLKYILGLEPYPNWNHRLGYGNMWHVCEEALAKGERWDTFHRYIDEQLKQHPLQNAEILKWANVCRVQFPEYTKYWAEHPDVQSCTPLLQEQVFNVPYTLPSGRVVRLRGKWDSVDLIPAHMDEHGQKWPIGVWLQENKTKGDIDRQQVERQLTFDLQTMMYLIALREEQCRLDDGTVKAKTTYRGLENGTPNPQGKFRHFYPILGVRYNVVRRPLSGGKGNISPHKAKSTKTKYTPAESDEGFFERLRRDYIAKEPSYWFFRVRAEVIQRDYDMFKRTCLDPLLEHLCYWYDTVTKTFTQPWYEGAPDMHYRTPFGIYNPLMENGATEYDAFLNTGSEAGLHRVETLFPELQ